MGVGLGMRTVCRMGTAICTTWKVGRRGLVGATAGHFERPVELYPHPRTQRPAGKFKNRVGIGRYR